MTRKEFEILQVGDNVRIGGIVGVVTEKDDMTYQLQSKFFSPNKRKDNMSLVSFAWNEGEILKGGEQ
jgi:hypothetical protein